MCELEALMEELLELARQNPGLLFRISPNKTYTGWGVEFTKGGHWWGAIATSPEESLKEIIKEALSYFERLTDDVMQSELAKITIKD
jgi:hypothetical protein